MTKIWLKLHKTVCAFDDLPQKRGQPRQSSEKRVTEASPRFTSVFRGASETSVRSEKRCLVRPCNMGQDELYLYRVYPGYWRLCRVYSCSLWLCSACYSLVPSWDHSLDYGPIWQPLKTGKWTFGPTLHRYIIWKLWTSLSISLPTCL